MEFIGRGKGTMKRFVIKASRYVLIVIGIMALATLGLYSLNFSRVNAPRAVVRYEHSVKHFYSGQILEEA